MLFRSLSAGRFNARNCELIFARTLKMKGVVFMELNTSRSRNDLALEIDSTAALIVNTQRKSGEIPWCEGEKTDPWDHVEAAMGLSIGGYFDEARHAFEWAAKKQLHDGSWYATYINGVPEDKTRDENMSSYI